MGTEYRNGTGELRAALGACRRGFAAAALFSFFINALMLVQPIYMMQVYNRILPTRSDETLLVLTVMVVALLAVMAFLDAVRSRILARVGGRLDVILGGRVLSAMFGAQLAGHRGASEGLRDLDQVRQFASGPGTGAFFDAPWTPLMIGLTFLFHPLLGVIASAGALLLFLLAALGEVAVRKPHEDAARQAAGLMAAIGGSLRNAETVEAMGMFPAIRRRAFQCRENLLVLQELAADRSAAISAVTKVTRIVLQVALLGVGAWLVNAGAMSPGGIIASSIVVGRALAPVETALGTWRQFIGARGAWRRLGELLTASPAEPPATALPAPMGALDLDGVTAAPPGGAVPTLRDVTLSVRPGEVLGVIGPSGGGKSTLARLMVGAWRPQSGKVRLDGADIMGRDRAAIGPHLGYLPQDVELFDGTVAENIARFGEMDSEKIVSAAMRAGAHDMILRLPKGYDTPIGPAGGVLSGGQRQRVGLARALYGQPVLVVLDEPNSNLDQDGEAALLMAVRHLKRSDVAVVLITHRPSVLGVVDTLAVVADGEIRQIGPRAEIMARLTRPVAVDEERQLARNER
ncbi:MAG: type I secretion system permease/ATPase [Alphaproteobacteria bacterium]|nr:type I secretion system permease/ATPase [Alphaproteobacteria bacterium]